MNSPRPTTILGAAVILAAFTAGATADDAGLTLSAGQKEWLQVEPILVTVAADTPGLDVPAVPGGDDASNGFRFEITPAVKPRDGARPLPGEPRGPAARSRVFDLLEWFEFPADGTFAVRAVAVSGGKRFASAPLTIVIRKPTGDEVEPVARIHHLPWTNYETEAYCGDTFDVVKRWPDSRIAAYCRYWNGRHSQKKKDYDNAVASYEDLITRHPDFPLVADARRALDECRQARKAK